MLLTHITQEKIMSNKNPYEIRFDVLTMAKDLLDKQYDMGMQQFYHMADFAKENSKDLQEVYEKYTPKMYQPTEIMAKAEELYKFIVKKD